MSSIENAFRGEKIFTADGDSDHHLCRKPYLDKQNSIDKCSISSNNTSVPSDSMAKVEASDRSSIETVENHVDTKEYKLQIVWTNVILQILLHSSFLWEYLYIRKNPDRWATHWTLLKFSE